jgi:hypothetical protein
MESEAIAILNSVDAGGRLAVALSSFPHIVRAEFDNDLEYRRACILTHLGPLGGFVSRRFENTKVGYTEAAVVESDGKLSFQLAPILRVPYGRAGLIEFRDLLLAMQVFYRTHAEYSPCIRITSNRNRRKATYGVISALYWFDRTDKPLHDTQCEAALRRRVDNSSALTSWLRQYALDLNKIGPCSWINVSSEMLFAHDHDPTRGWRNRNIAGEK